jgi:hypothetical protein
MISVLFSVAYTKVMTALSGYTVTNILTPAMQSFIFGGGSLGFPLPNSLFILSIN